MRRGVFTGAQMNIIADLHTHTLVSHHAYSTIAELIDEAKNKNLYAIAMTDHGPGLDDGAHRLHFKCLAKLPEVICGVKLFHGAELNIMDFKGSVDLGDAVLSKLHFVIASYHHEVIRSGTIEEHTNGWLGVVRNPYVDCLGHSGNPAYEFDFETVVKECAKLDKLIEINASSDEARPGSFPNCKKIALLCKQYGVHVAVNTDSHSRWTIGDFEPAVQLLEEIDFPEELVINSSLERLDAFFERKKKRLAIN